MDELVEAFDALDAGAAQPCKFDLLCRLDRTQESAGRTAFWQRVLLDTRQPSDVRTEVLKRLRALHARPEAQPDVTRCMLSVAQSDPDAPIRLHATAALGDVADDDEVGAALGRIIVDRRESLEQRYFALTSLQRGGPRPASMTLVGSITSDADLGKTASAILARWRARLRRESSRQQQ
jgi:hypothetical protein